MAIFIKSLSVFIYISDQQQHLTIRLAKDGCMLALKVSYAQSGHSRSTLLSSILNLMHYGKDQGNSMMMMTACGITIHL